METILDTGHSWFLERLSYKDSLAVYIIEGIKPEKPDKINIAGADLGEGYRINITEQSRRFLVIFEDVLAYQVTNESYTKGDEYEVRTKGVLCRYERSRYLDSVRAWTLIDSFRSGEYTHFGLILEDDIIDVIAETEPRIEQLSLGSS